MKQQFLHFKKIKIGHICYLKKNVTGETRIIPKFIRSNNCMFSFRGSTEEGERLVEKWGEVRDPSILRTEATPTNIHVSSVKGCINILRKPENKTRTKLSIRM